MVAIFTLILTIRSRTYISAIEEKERKNILHCVNKYNHDVIGTKYRFRKGAQNTKKNRLVGDRTKTQKITVYMIQAIKFRHRNEREEQARLHDDVTLLQ